MDHRFYPDSFENFLKEAVDDFRMYPSERVWTSIYNNIHPSRRWPTLGILLLLISSFAYIGASNNYVPAISTEQTTGTVQQFANNENNKIVQVQPEAAIELNNTAAFPLQTQKARRKAKRKLTQAATPNMSVSLSFLENALERNNKTEDLVLAENWDLTSHVGEKELLEFDQQKQLLATVSLLSNEGDENPAEEKNTSALTDEDEPKSDKDVVKKKKRSSQLSYQFYATPSIGYRYLSANTDAGVPAGNAFGAEPDQTPAVSHAGAINLETGANVLFRINNVIRLKGGLQLNYTNYYVNAYPLAHPAQTALMMRSGETGQPVYLSRTSTLSTSAGSGEAQNLSNNTYQVSLPVGADVRLAGNQTLQWYAGATIQPTYVAGGTAFLLSADQKNYIPDASLLRKFNMNGGFETFVSYKLKENLVFNAGPQFRYQFLSSYSRDFSYDEKLYNIGMKLGITTRF